MNKISKTTIIKLSRAFYQIKAYTNIKKDERKTRP